MTNKSVNVSNKLARISGLSESLLIPERTRALLWITDESPSNIQASMMGSVYMAGDIEPNSFYSEPSLIWTRLAVKPNDKLREEPYYYPTYMGLSPEERFQYLNWLRDITQPTNLSYAYLYYYGLERHLFIGDFDNAIEEMQVLLVHHKISEHFYSPSLALSSIARNKLDVADRMPSVFDATTDVSLALRILKKMPLATNMVIDLASQSGFTNKRYIKSHPELFKTELQKNIDDLEKKLGGPFFGVFKFDDLAPIKPYFANGALNNIAGEIEIPNVTASERFKDAIFDLLGKTHNNVKIKLASEAGRDTRNMANSIKNKPSRTAENERLNGIISQLVAQRQKSSYAGVDLTDTVPSRVFNKWMKQLTEIGEISKADPVKSNELALELFESGYRAPAIYERMAINYRKQKEYKLEADLLLQMKCDFGYNLDERLRSVLRLMEKSGELNLKD